MSAWLLNPVLAAAVVVLCSCGARSSVPRNEVVVVATTTQAGDLVHSVGGARVHLVQILKPNADPHEYEPRPSDATSLAGARLVVRSGGDVDDWLGGLVRAAGRGEPVLSLIDHVARRRKGGKIDPHWWQDPRNGARAVRAITEALAQVDPAGGKLYRRRSGQYLARLRRLDAQIARCVARIPRPQRKLVTTHDALGYYAERYGIKLVGALIPSLSTAAAPSARQVARLVSQIRRAHVRAIYPEKSLNPKLEQAIARQSGARVGSPLWADALGPSGTSGARYLGSLAANTQSIVTGLTGGRASCRPHDL